MKLPATTKRKRSTTGRLIAGLLAFIFGCFAEHAPAADQLSPFGVVGFVPSPTRWDAIAEAGIAWARVPFSWEMGEPIQGQFIWNTDPNGNEFTQMVREAENRGLHLYASLGYTPAWASNPAGGYNKPPRSVDEWYNYVYQCVSKYKGSVKHWEIWNEPNLTTFWSGTRSQFIQDVFIPAANAIHDADPEAQVVGPEISTVQNGQPTAWMTAALQDAGNLIDIISFHQYGDSAESRLGHIDNMYNLISNLGYGYKSIWLTECGWPSGNGGDAAQAQNLTKMLQGLESRPWLKKFFWYQIWEGGSDPGEWQGLLRQDGSRKPSWYAYRDYVATTGWGGPGPSNPSPPDSTAGVSLSTTLSWSSESWAAYHVLQLGTQNPPTGTAVVLFSPSYGATFLNPNTTYFWKVSDHNANGTVHKAGPVWQFTTASATTPPAQTSNPIPDDGDSGVVISADLQWNGGGATTYRVYFGTESPPEFRGEQSLPTFEPGVLATNQQYFWRIDAVNNVGVSQGDVWTFSTSAVPGYPTNPLPADGASNIIRDPRLTWTQGAGATSSHIYFGIDNPPPYVSGESSQPFRPALLPEYGGGLSPGTTYYWRINPHNGAGTTWGPVWRFTTAPLPGPITNPSPANGVIGAQLSPMLRWTAGSNATSYNIFFGTTQPLPYIRTQSATDFAPGGLAPGTTYLWRINSKNVAGVTAGPLLSFTTLSLPEQASAPTPASGEVGVSPLQVLSWSAGDWAASHDVYFGSSTPPTFRRNQTEATYSPGSLISGRTYYWRIDERNGAGTTAGETWSFTTDMPQVSIDDLLVAEPTSGTASHEWRVTLSNASEGPVSVPFVVQACTAAAGTDYIAEANGDLEFDSGIVSLPIPLDIVGDTALEGHEIFSVQLGTPSGAELADGYGQVTIVDNNDEVLGIVRADFDGDGNNDAVWFDPESGSYGVWKLVGLTILQSEPFVPAAPAQAGWSLAGVADFDGDTGPDLLWRNAASGNLSVWYMDGTVRRAGSTFYGPADIGWTLVGTANFGGDGSIDLLWRDPATGALYAWIMSGLDLIEERPFSPLAPASLNWIPTLLADWNADGATDLLLRNSSSGAVVVWYLEGTKRIGGQPLLPTVGDLGWQVASAFDADADGTTDLLWQHQLSGSVVVWLMDGLTRRCAGLVVPEGPETQGLDLVGPR